jgi:hypothetical protein
LRTILAAVAGVVLMGAAGIHPDPAATVAAALRVQARLQSIAEDIAAIFESASGGIDGPKSPLNDPIALKDTHAHLDSATRTAEELATDLRDLEQADRSRDR